MLRRFTCGSIDIAVNLSAEPVEGVAPWTVILSWHGHICEEWDHLRDYSEHPPSHPSYAPYPDLATWLAAGACSEACDEDSLCAGALAYDERSDMFILIPSL